MFLIINTIKKLGWKSDNGYLLKIDLISIGKIGEENDAIVKKIENKLVIFYDFKK